MRTSEPALAQGAVDPEISQLLEAAFAQAAATNLLPRLFISERALKSPGFRLSWREMRELGKARNSDPLPALSGKPNPLLWLSGLMERELLPYLRVMSGAMELAVLPPPQCLQLTNHFAAAQQEAASDSHVLAGMLMYGAQRLVISDVSTHAHLHLAETALAVERFRSRYQRLPNSLEELAVGLATALPVDPFTGGPLGYRTSPNGYALYSVGPDGVDQGGREPPAQRKSRDTNSYDLTFVVER